MWYLCGIKNQNIRRDLSFSDTCGKKRRKFKTLHEEKWRCKTQYNFSRNSTQKKDPPIDQSYTIFLVVERNQQVDFCFVLFFSNQFSKHKKTLNFAQLLPKLCKKQPRRIASDYIIHIFTFKGRPVKCPCPSECSKSTWNSHSSPLFSKTKKMGEKKKSKSRK